jgi:tRNA dimethylallyltransferase
MSKTKPRTIVIVGPTSSGKSELAVRLARKYGGEVISADSRQVYRGLDIGSGKITKKEMRGVPHHLLDVASPRRVFTAADFKRLGKKALVDIARRGKTPIIAGGTAFYIDALLYDIPLPQVKPDPKLRARLEKKTAAELFSQLKRLDPRRAKTIEKQNKRRLIRALEIIISTGKPVPSFVMPANSQKKPGFDVLKIGISPAPDILKKKIHERLIKRLRLGMIEEVEQLHANGLSWKRLDELGLEYRYVARYLRGIITREEMITVMEKEIKNYARRQMTWWRRDKDIKWISSANRQVPS